MISVIIPTFRRFEPLVTTLTDLLQQAGPAFEIVVADQNPEWPQEFREVLARLRADARVHWLTLPQPGVVRARNAAVAKSTGDILLFVDDDVRVPYAGLVARHARTFDNPEIAAVVGRERQVGDQIPESAFDAGSGPSEFLPAESGLSPLQQALRFDRNGDLAKHVCTFCTCNSSVRRAAFLAVGGFDELFAGNSYGDDYDLALRMHAKGFAMVYEPRAWLVHRKAPVGGLRLTDRTNKVDGVATLQGAWLFVLRHGHRGMYGYLMVHHVLRKTVLLRRNLVRPWRQPLAVFQTVGGLIRALSCRSRGPVSAFTRRPAPVV